LFSPACNSLLPCTVSVLVYCTCTCYLFNSRHFLRTRAFACRRWDFFLDQDKFRYSDLAIHFPPAKTCRNGKRAKAGLQRAFETLGIPCENARTYARSHRTSHRLIFLLPRANGRSHRVLGTGRVRAFFARWCFANRGAIHETRKGNMIKMGLVWFGNGRLHARSGRR
jgi:hypothetical protein